MNDRGGAPSPRRYTREHLWVQRDRADGPVRIGLAATALEGMGEVTILDLPDVGARIAAGEAFGVVGSTKSEADLVAPLGGTVTERNGAAGGPPRGGAAPPAPTEGLWLLDLDPDDPAWDPAAAGLLDEDGYRRHAGGSG